MKHGNVCGKQVGVILTQHFRTNTSNIVSSQKLQQSVLVISDGATEQLKPRSELKLQRRGSWWINDQGAQTVE